MCPPGKVTEFFGFFSFSGKITAFAAPLLIGVVTHATDSQRIGIATSLAFLVAGLLLLLNEELRAECVLSTGIVLVRRCGM